MVPDCLITRVRLVAPATKDGGWVVATALDLTGLYNSRDSTGSGEGLRGRRFQATPRQPGLNSHLNASEVALTAITADGRLLTHALPAKAEPPTNPPASLDGASRSLSPPPSFSSRLVSFLLPTCFLPICSLSLPQRPTCLLLWRYQENAAKA